VIFGAALPLDKTSVAADAPSAATLGLVDLAVDSSSDASIFTAFVGLRILVQTRLNWCRRILRSIFLDVVGHADLLSVNAPTTSRAVIVFRLMFFAIHSSCETRVRTIFSCLRVSV
jgi:hypothetical protein